MTQPQASWSLLVYIAAHNNLATHGNTSLQQLIAAGSTPQVKLAALYDKPMGATRHLIGPPGQQDEESLGNFDSGDPDALLETVKWAFERHPARRYGLVLWSHGSGYWTHEELKKIALEVHAAHGEMVTPEREAAVRAGSAERAAGERSMALFRTTLRRILAPASSAERAILYDDGTAHSVDTLELQRVMRAIQAFIGQPLDLLGMDACLMGNLEVAYQVRDAVGCLVASEELVPGTSWPYPAILSALQAQPEMSAADLAKLIVARYAAHYTTNPPKLNGGDVTKVALDLGQIEALRQPAKALAEALLSHAPASFQALHRAQYDTFTKETWGQRRHTHKTKFGYHLWDAATLAAGLASADAHPDVRAAAEALIAAVRPGGAVLAEVHLGEWFDGIGGLSVYMAPPDKPQSAEYTNLAFAQDTGWGRMLAAYRDWRESQ